MTTSPGRNCGSKTRRSLYTQVNCLHLDNLFAWVAEDSGYSAEPSRTHTAFLSCDMWLSCLQVKDLICPDVSPGLSANSKSVMEGADVPKN
mmetsp:Transcript_120743/g.240474  ORF Transcript_120743/g.240474 Transcript_120743/m.240474 type:complete len:91 (+) Transcript_120743:84-356(+)